MHSEGTTRPESGQTKPCSKCGRELPLAEFSPDKRTKLGVGSSCKGCNRNRMKACVSRYREATQARNRRYREANAVELSEKNRRWREENQDRISAGRRAKYPEIRESALAYQVEYREENRAQINARQRRYYAAHKDEHRERNKLWRRRHPERFKAAMKARRAAKFGASIVALTSAEWRQIKADFGHRCAYCGREDVPLTQDHVIPLSKGGPHTKDNVVPACQPCNSSKGAGDLPKHLQEENCP